METMLIHIYYTDMCNYLFFNNLKNSISFS